jgi:AraC family transcriptional regulator, regulatory protein of adaptative response / methylphosphotriester-DNA alkyltransferase methyltransferase
MATRPSTHERREDLLREALEIMYADHGQPLELDDIARRIATSRRHLQRVFRELHGEPFRTALTNIRLDRAAALLAGPEQIKIREVARQVGYQEPAQFAKAFRRRHGVVPSEYRARAVERRRSQR